MPLKITVTLAFAALAASCGKESSDEPSSKSTADACVPAEVQAAAFAGCDCGDAPWEKIDGCEGDSSTIPDTRVCQLDSSCHSYWTTLEADDLVANQTRDDVAVRFEFARPIPPDAVITVNAGADSTNYLDWPTCWLLWASDDDIPVVDVVVADDRLSLTLVATGQCLAGRVLLDANCFYEKLYNYDFCGPDVMLSYGGYFALE